MTTSAPGQVRNQKKAESAAPVQLSVSDPSRSDLEVRSNTDPSLAKPDLTVPEAGTTAKQTPYSPAESATSKLDDGTKMQSGSGMMEVSVEERRVMTDREPSSAEKVFSVQVGGFLLEENAIRFRQKLVGLGYDARIVPTPISDGRVMNRVLVGRFSSQARAAEELATIRDKEKLEGYLTTHTR